MRRPLLPLLLLLCLCACAPAAPPEEPEGEALELRYAQCFSLTAREEGGTVLTVEDGQRFLLLPEEVPAPEGERVLRVPMKNLYLADSSAMDLFSCLEALDCVRLSALDESAWTLPEPREAMARGELLYAGKYSAPDYELLLEEGCTLALENTMLLHSPEIREQLEALGIPVLISRSSYEPHPLGRLEWVKLYGLLTGRLEQAVDWFETQARQVEELSLEEPTGKQGAIFYLSSSGAVNVRAPGDYITRMLELAGGSSAFSSLELPPESTRAAVNLQAEEFYALAREADIFLYNGSIDGGLESVEELLEQAPWLSDCKAVREGEVWCIRRDLFQRSSGAAEIIREFHAVLTGTAEGTELEYLYHLS